MAAAKLEYLAEARRNMAMKDLDKIDLADLAAISLYGLHFAIENRRDDEELLFAAKNEIQERLIEIQEDPSDADLSELDMNKTFDMLFKKIQQCTANDSKKKEVLRSMLKALEKVDAVKEPRNIRLALQQVDECERDLWEAGELLEKWRAGKLKMKSVQDCNNLVSRERELVKEYEKRLCKLEKLRVLRNAAGNPDSDDGKIL